MKQANKKLSLRTRLGNLVRRKDGADYFWQVRNKAIHGSNPISRWINWLLHRRLMTQFNASIPFSVEFGGKPVFPHGLNGIFISASAKLGTGCVIFHQVTIGSNSLPDSKGQGFPTLGNNVYIGCGAKIIGNVHIGNNVRIGANCVITEDIPDNATVVLERPRILVRQKPQDNRFIPHTKFPD